MAAALSAGNAEFERASVVGAAEITVARLRAEAVAGTSVTGVLERAMLDDPARFASLSRARREGGEVFANAVGEKYRRAVDAALARLAGTRTAEEAFGADFVRSVCVLSEADRRRVLAGPYTNAFARERIAACRAQERELVAAVRPAMSVVDSDDEAKVREALRANIAAQSRHAVFEENIDYISQKIVDPLLADAKSEKRRQQKYVGSVRSEACAPSALAKDIVWKLGENVRERAAKTEDAARRWEIFPSVTNRTLAASVERRILKRLTDEIAEAKIDVSERAVSKLLASGGESHRTAAASRAALHAAYSSALLANAVEADVRGATAAERTELADYLKARLAGKAVSDAVSRRLDAELDPVLKRVRATFAEREFAARWPTLADRTWYPSAALADDIAARSDFSASVRRWRRIPELGAFNLRATLEEAEEKADRAILGSFELARAAVAGQTKAVDEVKPSVLAEARDRKASFFRRTPDFKAIVGLLTEATAARWRERKNAVLWAESDLPKNADAQHAELFPSVKRRIELVAKEILEDMRTPEPDGRPETPPPDETPPEDPKVEFTILVNRKDDRITVRLEQGGSSIVSRETPADMAPFRAAMKEVSDKLGSEILKLGK